MEVAVELEDDLFFADLSKRISLLIMDDDGGVGDEEPVSGCPSVSFQTFCGANYPITQSQYLQEQICRRESKGTGFFIPKAPHPRRKHRQGKYSSFNRKSNRQDDNTTKMASQTCFNHSFYPGKS
ncbi:uncharacterized protein LOC120195617 [Hibiscus syriacus]|uniref:uncharacterized protein LOC120195617 n=1 Tax=Hibiscus syriacus TaxID=106335 RepID=UPI001923BBCB|nr:uncharacterized protein LOC120195617 [Hibiscus syriacus]